MKNKFAICETVADLKEFLDTIPDNTPLDREQCKAIVRKTVYLGSGGVERMELAFVEDDEDDE